MFLVWTLLIKPPVGLEMCVSRHSAVDDGLLMYAAAVTTRSVSGINNVENWMKANETKGAPVQSIKPFSQTHTE